MLVEGCSHHMKRTVSVTCAGMVHGALRMSNFGGAVRTGAWREHAAALREG